MGRAPDEQGGASRLVAVKAVSERLSAARRVAAAQCSPTRRWQRRAAPPEPGTVWVDAGAARCAAAEAGRHAAAGRCGAADRRASSSSSPTAAPASSSFAPRVLLNQADLPATGLIQPASRVNYRLAVAAPAGPRRRRCASFVALGRRRRSRRRRCAACASSRCESGRPEMRQTLDRAEKFLNLVALLAALLAAVAVGIAAREFATRHLDDCAMLRVLGLSQRRSRCLLRSSSRSSACWPAWPAC